MAQVISITITESSVQVLYGIPKYIILSTNIPSTIYYTFDGSTPNTSSQIYLGGQLKLPTNQTTVILSLFATDGTDTSPIINQTYKPDITGIRQSHDQVTDLGTNDAPMNYPYGNLSPELPAVYDNIGGDIVNSPAVENYPDGYGWDGTGTGTGVGFTDNALTSYPLVYSVANYQGERGNGIGTLPAKVTIRTPDPPPNFSSTNSSTFDPRALVIYQDNTKEQYDANVPNINRQYFSLENAERTKDGVLLNTTSIEGLAPTGSLVRTVFNPRNNTVKYYYFDSQALRWIIAKEPYQPSRTQNKLYNIIFSSRPGERFVYKWRPFAQRRLI